MSARQHRSGVRSIAVNPFSLASVSVFRSLARAIYAVLLARYLGVAAYGIFNYGLAGYLVFVPLAILGLDRILVREVARQGAQAAALIDRTFTSTVIAAAVHWYQQGRISQEWAARIAGMDRTDFLLTLAKLGKEFFIVDLDDLDDELARG